MSNFLESLTKQVNKTRNHLPNTRVQLANTLGISKTTISRYEGVARYLEEFEGDYQEDSDGNIFYGLALTNYQCWVLCKINSYSKRRLTTRKRLESDFLNSTGFASDFSKEEFEKSFTVTEDEETEATQNNTTATNALTVVDVQVIE